MSWNNCRKCVFLPRANFTSAIFNVLLTLKLLHGGRSGAKGSTLEDIAMHMMKYYPLDGDIKSQVLASLKYGVKMHFIQKRKEKFALILPASSVQLAPCKFKNEEIERINCIFPPVWQSNACNDSSCGGGDQTCCGKRKRALASACCQEDDDDEDGDDTCGTCSASKSKRSKSSCKQSGRSRMSVGQSSCECCNAGAKKKPKRSAPCPKPKPPTCGRKRGKSGRSKNVYDDYCLLCENADPDDMACNPAYKYEAYKNCACCDK